MSDSKKCEHKSCKCMAKPDEKFCSQFCKDSTDVQTLTCDCGHPGCTTSL